MALDTLLTKEGGACDMVGDQCCTYIPENDGINGNISEALEKMKLITHKLCADEHGERSWGLLYN